MTTTLHMTNRIPTYLLNEGERKNAYEKVTLQLDSIHDLLMTALPYNVTPNYARALKLSKSNWAYNNLRVRDDSLVVAYAGITDNQYRDELELLERLNRAGFGGWKSELDFILRTVDFSKLDRARQMDNELYVTNNPHMAFRATEGLTQYNTRDGQNWVYFSHCDAETLKCGVHVGASDWAWTVEKVRMVIGGKSCAGSPARAVREALKNGYIEVVVFMAGWLKDGKGEYVKYDNYQPIVTKLYLEPR